MLPPVSAWTPFARIPTMGTLNLCHRAGFYDDHHLPRMRLVAQLALPALLMIART
jgi:hypothetical protein